MAMMPTIFLLFCKRLGLVSAAVLTTLVLVETLLSIFSSKPQLAFEWVLDEVHQNHRVFDEETLFKVAHAYQQATDWHKQKPEL